MSVPMALLTFLFTQPAHGLSLKRQYDATLPAAPPVKTGQVYSTLSRLQRDGLCVGLGFEKTSAGDRQLYAITEAGAARVSDWLTTPHIDAGHARSDMYAKVVLSVQAGLDAQAVIDAHRQACSDRVTSLKQHMPEADALTRVALEYEITHLVADEEWLAAFERSLPTVKSALL